MVRFRAANSESNQIVCQNPDSGLPLHWIRIYIVSLIRPQPRPGHRRRKNWSPRPSRSVVGRFFLLYRMASTGWTSSRVSYIASRVYFVLIIFQIPLFRYSSSQSVAHRLPSFFFFPLLFLLKRALFSISFVVETITRFVKIS